jgi:hypothetical protein
MKHTLEEFILTYINVLIFVITTFDLWMRKGTFDAFVFVISFLTLHWEPKHVTIGSFEVKGISKINLVNRLQIFFEKYKLIKKIICYVKYQSTILFTMTIAFKQIVSCEKLGML